MRSYNSFILENNAYKGHTLETLLQDVAQVVKAQDAVKVHTTLYDLIAAINKDVSSDEDHVLTATVVHLLNTYRVTCTGALQGYRLVGPQAVPLGQSIPKRNGRFSQFERVGDHSERLSYQATS